uniref:Uncharacterized protein n=1 Tax=Schistocephalus solidus TaxID=70667 RepID=A0A0X3P9J2_SCHSO
MHPPLSLSLSLSASSHTHGPPAADPTCGGHGGVGCQGSPTVPANPGLLSNSTHDRFNSLDVSAVGFKREPCNLAHSREIYRVIPLVGTFSSQDLYRAETDAWKGLLLSMTAVHVEDELISPQAHFRLQCPRCLLNQTLFSR